ncbi:MAG: AbrB/MazE/SpoVT family DNA-binding domain-containing protein [Bryobacteraceae bacterium]
MSNDIKISKWGNSLAVRIPQAIARQARLAEGDRVTLDHASDGGIVLRSARRKYALHDLVRRISKTNRHSEADWGNPIGQEFW